jgi:hypothetical protein
MNREGMRLRPVTPASRTTSTRYFVGCDGFMTTHGGQDRPGGGRGDSERRRRLERWVACTLGIRLLDHRWAFLRRLPVASLVTWPDPTALYRS